MRNNAHPLLFAEKEPTARHPANDAAARVEPAVSWLSHAGIIPYSAVTPPLLLHQWGLTLRLSRQYVTGRQMGQGLGIGGYIAMLCLDSFRRFIDAYSTTPYSTNGVPPRVNKL